MGSERWLTFSGMLADLVATHGLSVSDSGRLYAMTFTAYGDAFIGCLNAKYYFNFWRPATAIHQGDTDGNVGTAADSNWAPLDPTPNHPEYPAAHGCITGAVTSVLASYFGSPNLMLNVTAKYPTPVALGGGTQTATRSFNSTKSFLQELQVARIYGGMHFHHSIIQDTVLGQRAANHLVNNYFQASK